jgi:hypothetical protein
MCAGVGLFGMFSGFLASWFVAPDTKQGQQDLDALRQEIRDLRVLIEASTSTSAARPALAEHAPQNVASE